MASRSPTADANTPPAAPKDDPPTPPGISKVQIDDDPKKAASPEESDTAVELKDNATTPFKPSPRFWAIMATLCVVGLLAAFENTVVATSLPFIVEELNLGENYIWIPNVFFLTR
jgi:hypothetical protein